MLDKPRLADDRIIAGVRAAYGLAVRGLELLPVGYDSNAGVYRLTTPQGRVYFLKVRSTPVAAVSLALAQYLQAQGLAQVVAPLPTQVSLAEGPALAAQIDGFTLILYPFIEGACGWDVGLTDAQWHEIGAVLKRLHTLSLPPDLARQMPREQFIPHPARTALLQQIHAEIGQRTHAAPHAQQLAAFWRTQHAEIDTVIAHTAHLSARLQGYAAQHVVCHADIHVGNVLLDAQGGLYIVDWDEPRLAPRELDLMFVTGDSFQSDARTERLFFEGYGPVEFDALVMAYFRYARVAEDLAEFAELILDDDASDAARTDALHQFIDQFAPGRLLAAAHALDHVLAG